LLFFPQNLNIGKTKYLNQIFTINVVQLLLSCIQLPPASAGEPGKRVRHPNRPRTIPGMKNKISFERSRKN
jgi:hypothetical protein